MCGIAGFWGAIVREEALIGGIRSMIDTLSHRGPDDDGIWTNEATGLALGFRRLAIVDLSSAGHQPMPSKSGRYVITFNGEVYNFAELRHELEARGHTFHGHSDTEVVLAAVEQWGLKAAVDRFVGMFAFALWDFQERSLSLVRDRLGIKPLYYGWMGQTLIWGSELKALRPHPSFRAEIDRGALGLYIRHSYVPGPQTIYRGIYQLPPGSIVTVTSPTDRQPATPYWSAGEVAERGVRERFTGSGEEAVRELDGLLRQAVGLRMIADVPLGAFLSGGIDSSTVVALMQAQSSRPIKTFSIGFHEDGFNEAHHALEVARHLGTDHTELYVTPMEARDVIPCLPDIYDEPFADASQIPTVLVSRLTRRSVTVALSGDGGDEVFAGYGRYFSGADLWNRVGLLPVAVRGVLARGIAAASPAAYDRVLRHVPFEAQAGSRLSGHHLRRLAEVMSAPSRQLLYRSIVSQEQNPSSLVMDAYEPYSVLSDAVSLPALSGFLEEMQYLDTVTYLPDDILTKVDRASMSVGLEARVPLLDHRVVEFAWRLPTDMKVRDKQGKWPLRQVLYHYVPQSLVERPKMGFGVPIAAWLRGPLQDWAATLLDEKSLEEQGVFQATAVRQKWQQHLSGSHDWEGVLWSVLMFQAWLARWGSVDVQSAA